MFSLWKLGALFGVRIALLLIVILLIVVPVFAQEATLEPSPTPPPASGVIPADALTPDQAKDLGQQTFMSAIGAFFNAAITVTIVGALKLFIPPEWDIDTVKKVVATVLTVGWLAAVKFNFSETFASVAQFISVALPAAITLYGGLKGAPAIHEVASAVHFPILGYDRTPGY